MSQTDIVPLTPDDIGLPRGREIELPGTAGAVARIEAEMKAQLVLARSNPRDPHAAYTNLMKTCQRPTFAAKDTVIYRFPRGGKTIEGPGAALAREMARTWGNIRYGIQVLSQDANWIHIKGYAFDLETNTSSENEGKFRRLIFRKDKGWVEPDERDLRMLVQSQGAILERNSILKLMPPDVIEAACEAVRKTRKKVASGDLRQNRTDLIRTMTVSFSQYGVTPEQIATYIGHPLEQMSEEDVVNLRSVFGAIVDGVSKPSDYFAGEKAPVEDKVQAMKKQAAAMKAKMQKQVAEPKQAAAKPAKAPAKPAEPKQPQEQAPLLDEEGRPV